MICADQVLKAWWSKTDKSRPKGGVAGTKDGDSVGMVNRLGEWQLMMISGNYQDVADRDHRVVF